MLYTMLTILFCALISPAYVVGGSSSELQNVKAQLKNMFESVMDTLESFECLRPCDCQDIQRLGKPTGVYTIYPDGNIGIRVRCDMDTDQGGWTVIQRRVSNTDFYKTWEEYRVGFGDLEHNFWLGNEIIHMISSQGTHKLRIDMSNTENDKRYAMYDGFTMASVKYKFRLTIGRYRGNAGDSLAVHKGQYFSAKDVDNDRSPTNCAVTYKGAWWYNECHWANLNGEYGNNNFGEGINWYTWEDHRKSLRTTEMKIRKA